MVSPTITKGIADHMCFSFWFAAFGAGIYIFLFFYTCMYIFNFFITLGDTTSLKIYRQDVRGGEDNDNNNDDDNSPTVS